jgi:general secretion pathway protein M
MNRLRELWESAWDRIAASALGQKAWAHYESAAPREQLILQLLGAFVLLLIVVLLVVMPLHQYHQNAVASYLQQQETLTWMQTNRALIGSAAPSARKPGDSLLTIANQSARAAGLTFKRYEPKGEKGLNLWLEKVPFNQVVTWLAALESTYGVVAVEFSASRRDEAGFVDVRVSLEG